MRRESSEERRPHKSNSLMSKRLAEEPAEGDHSEKKNQLAEEPEYSDRIFEEALEELKAERVAHVERVKTMRRLVKEFKAKVLEANVLGLLNWELERWLQNAEPVNAPVPLQPITANQVGSQAARNLCVAIAKLRPEAEDEHPSRSYTKKGECLFDYIRQACVPSDRRGGRILPVNFAIDSAKSVGLVKIIDYLPRLKKISAKFHAKFKQQPE